MNKAYRISIQSKISTLKANIRTCDKWIQKHSQVISKNTENMRRSSSPTYKKQCSDIINARKAAIAEYRSRKDKYHKALSQAMRQLSQIR